MSYLALLFVRSLGLGSLAGLALRACRVRSASAKHAVWTVVTAVMLLQIVVSPALPTLPIRILAPVTDTAPTPPFAFGSLPIHDSNSHAPAGQLPSWRTIAMWAYAAIATALFVRLFFGYLFTRRLVRRSRSINVTQGNSVARIRESERISVPLTVGQIRPTILLPTSWREWDSAKLRAVLAHEEAHIRRWDWAIGLMARINCCVFWFHPLSWWLKRQLAVLAEHACDDFVLTQTGDRQQYAQALLEVACAMKSAHGRLVAMSMAKETNVQKRLDQILDKSRPIPPALGRRGWAMLLVCSLPVGYFLSAAQLAPAQNRTVVSALQPAAKDQPVQIAQARPAALPQAPTQAAPAPAPARLLASLETPYQKWLGEEVTYIIADDEARAFRRLQTDDEREAFIEQFWLRRDPTPDTPENEMKEEHYRRIAWANDRYAASIPGWKTDRGAIYIKYGPPDAMDSHGATATTYPFENWYYRGITGLTTPTEFEFVDPTMTGRYHLTKDPSEKNRQ